MCISETKRTYWMWKAEARERSLHVNFGKELETQTQTGIYFQKKITEKITAFEIYLNLGLIRLLFSKFFIF